MKSVAFLLLAAGASCRPPLLPVAGSYLEHARTDAILLEVSTLIIKPNQAFFYVRWSDDLSSGRYGSGTYRLAGKQLRLQFEESPPPMAAAQSAPLKDRPDSLIFTFTVLGSCSTASGGDTLAPVPTAIVTGWTADGRVLAAVAAGPTGQARLAFAQAARPVRLQAEHLGFETWRQACPTASTAYRVHLPAAQGTPYPAGTVKEFRVRRLSTQHLMLSQGRHHLKLVRQETER